MTKRLAAIAAAVLATTLAASTATSLAASKARPKATATPAVADPNETPTTTSGERPITTGTAKCKLGAKALEFKKAGGSFQSSGGFQIASLKFEGGKGERLQIDFMYQGTGTVTTDYIQHLYAIDEDKAISAMKPHVSTCTVTLAKASPTMVEGTASCPKGMLNEDKPGRPITDIEFHAEAQ
ncbi:MAG TPA: hypothetical protein VMV18_10265 [bacterium]|nr:hypothetical protein [bacterium]